MLLRRGAIKLQKFRESVIKISLRKRVNIKLKFASEKLYQALRKKLYK